MPHPSNHALSSTSRAALSALTCLRAFPRHRQRTSSCSIQQAGSPSPNCGYRGLGTEGGVANAGNRATAYLGLGGRRWASSAAALAVREEEEAELVVILQQSRGHAADRSAEVVIERSMDNEGPEKRTFTSVDDGKSTPDLAQKLIDDSLFALDTRMAEDSLSKARSSSSRGKPLKGKSTPSKSNTGPESGEPAAKCTAAPASTCSSSTNDAAPTSSDASTSAQNTTPPQDPETDEIIWDTEYILDHALSSTLKMPSSGARLQSSSAARDLPWPTRHLRLRTVRPVDVEFAENAFNQARRRLAELESRNTEHIDTLHREVLMAHINHMLYLAARVPDLRTFSRIKAYLREHDLEPDSHTYLTRLILMDKMNQMNQLAAICRSFNQRRVVPENRARQGAAKKWKTIDGEDATVLLNMTIWMLAKRAQWDIVGPAYNKLLIHTPHATKHMSSAFPPDYFTPSHDLSYNLYFRNSTALNKITYQSLIRALAFHGNIVPALAVMQDMLNDSRGYTVALSDFVALFQGFARFGRIPVGWEDLNQLPDREGTVDGSDVYANTMASLRPDSREETNVSSASAKTAEPTQRGMFPPPIFPEPSRPGSGATAAPKRSQKMDALKQMTEIWAGKINTWDQERGTEDTPPSSTPTRLEREWTLVTLQQVFQSFLAISPVFDSPEFPTSSGNLSSLDNAEESKSRSRTKKWWESSLAEAPSPRNIYYIMLAFSRTTDTNVPVLRAVWQHLESKFGEGNEEGWTGWRLDARLRRLKDWLAVEPRGRL